MRFLSSVFLSLALFSCGDDGGMTMPMDAGTADGGGGGMDAGPATSTERPTKRSDLLGIADPASGLIAYFGGDDGPIVDQIPRARYLDETWVFEPGFGHTQVIGDPHPSARGRHAAVLDSNEGRMLVFGGRWRAEGTSGNYTLYNDLWAFDFETRTWEMLHDGSGTAPRPRYFAGLGYDASTSTIYVGGGSLNANALSVEPATDLWAFDGSAWSEVTTSGTPPSSRTFVAWTNDTARNKLIAYGGQVGDFVTAPFGDLYELDLGTGVWTQLHDGSGTAPAGRFNSAMSYDATNDRYLLFGGHELFIMMNDVWAWNAASGGWAQLSAGDTIAGAGLGCLGNPREIPADFTVQDLSTPQPRQTPVLAELGGVIWLFGGESDCSDHLDDTWSFDLAGGAWSEMIEARTGESCERRGDDCTCMCL